MENTNILTDKNGREMRTGNIVKVENAYFKNDNGYYYIAHTPGDITWCGNDYSLKKICQNGKISQASHTVAFWPLSAFCNDRAKNQAAREHNKQYATIEIIDTIDNSEVIAEFEREANAHAETAKTYSYRYGENSEVTLKTQQIGEFYQNLADTMKAAKEVKTESPADLICEPELVASVVYDFGVSDIDEEPAPQKPETVKKYYDISEETARRGHDSVHMSEYKANSATNGYRAAVDEAYEIAERQKKKVSEFYHEKIDALVDKYARKYAEWTNNYNRNQASCPSWFVCGPANYPVKKFQRQQARENSLWQEYEQIQGILEKIKSVGTGPIDLTDPHAKEMLEDRLQKLQKELDESKELNAYWRKHKTFVGCPVIKPEHAEKRTEDFKQTLKDCPWISSPCPAYELTSLRDRIKRTQARLDELNMRQTTESKEDAHEGFKVVENNEIMRLQIIFDYKPDEETRNVLKSNGFKWAPSQSAWQRQLTPNAQYALKRVLEVIA